MLDPYTSSVTTWEGMARPQVQINNETMHQKRIPVGPFLVSYALLNAVDTHELQLIRLVFDLSSPSDEVFRSSLWFLKQSEFTTLKPEALLDSLVINIFAEILTYDERNKGTKPLNWYLPETFSEAALNRDVTSFLSYVKRNKTEENYTCELECCEKMFIPVHTHLPVPTEENSTEKNSRGHFYLYIVHMKKEEIEIWDSLPDHCIPKEERDKTTQKLLVALDKLYEEDIRKSGKAFSKFQRRMASDILLQSNDYDCGIFVIKYMQQSKNYVKKDRSFKFDSEEERLNLALQLLRSDINENRKTLYDKVCESYNVQRVNEQGPDLSKGKSIDKCKTFSEDVGRRAYEELDSSHERVGKNVGLDKGKAIMHGAGENISASNTEKNPTNLEGKGKKHGAGGRPKSEVWDHVRVKGNKVECIYCGIKFAKSANRIKSHLDPTPQRKGIRPCTKFQAANSNKRFKPNISALNPEMNSTPTNLKGHGKGYLLPATDLVGKKFQGCIKKIWKWLMEDEVSAIGVWGMAGAGKTALVTHIHNKLLEEADAHFDHVIWVTVSQNDSTSQLQKVIAKSIGLDISDEYDIKRVAGKLLHAFNQMNKYVLILDEVWDYIFLENVGCPVLDKGIKLILTTRSREVCQSMNCKENIIEVELLDEEDGWDLFERTLGVYQKLSPEVEKVAREVRYYCADLPLVIVTIARSMKGKNGVREWNHMLESLRNLENGQDEMDKWVFPILRSSYAHLNNKLLECFLYCASDHIYLVDFHSKKSLIRKFVHEGWIDGTKRLKEQHNECMRIIDKFYSNCFMKEYGRYQKIHKFIGVTVRREKNDTIMAKAHMRLTEVPEDYKWGENLQKVFLNSNHIQKIPDGMSPRCSQLSTLHLNDNNELESIPDDFFINMPSLRVLDLSRTGIRRLPTSVSNLECLVALLLSRCESLSDMPSLAKQRRLMSLDLSYTAITEAPSGLELMINLRYLNLHGTRQLKMSTSSVISKLTNLQSLHLNYITEMDVREEDLIGLKALEDVVASFCKVEVFNKYVTSLLNRGRPLENYLFAAVTDCFYHESPVYDEFGDGKNFQKLILFDSLELGDTAVVLPDEVKWLKITSCHIKQSCVCQVLSFHKDSIEWEMEQVEICKCHGMQYLFCFSSGCSVCWFAQLTGHLKLLNLEDLKNIVPPSTPATDIFCKLKSLHIATDIFCKLKSLHIERCNSVKTLLTPELSAELQHLESIFISTCNSMEEIVSNRSGQEDLSEMVLLDHTISLPKLRHVTLRHLPELKSVYRGVMLCASFESFHSLYCVNLTEPKIKKILDGDILQMKKTPAGYKHGNDPCRGTAPFLECSESSSESD